MNSWLPWSIPGHPRPRPRALTGLPFRSSDVPQHIVELDLCGYWECWRAEEGITRFALDDRSSRLMGALAHALLAGGGWRRCTARQASLLLLNVWQTPASPARKSALFRTRSRTSVSASLSETKVWRLCDGVHWCQTRALSLFGSDPDAGQAQRLRHADSAADSAFLVSPFAIRLLPGLDANQLPLDGIV
jgi:hypothetical protein